MPPRTMFLPRCSVALSAVVWMVAPCGALLGAQSSDLVLVERGQPRAAIVTADAPAPSARDAAEALQKTIHAMTGATLPLQTESEFDGPGAAILVGQSALAAEAGVSIEQDYERGDHYVIRSHDNRLILVGNDSRRLRGTAYAAYDLLQRLGCGWYGPDPAWHVFPRTDSLSVPPLHIDEKPAFLFRDNWVVQKMGPPLTDAWRIGGWRLDHGHALDRWLPRREYEADHPDWFRHAQPCLTNPEVIETITRRLRERLDAEEGVVSLSLSANDSKDHCECDSCRAAGDVSSRYLAFVNAIARRLAGTHPDRYLLTFYAYWMTHDAPAPSLRAEPGVCVMQVNEGNHMKPWDSPESERIRTLERNDNNYREVVAFEGWRKTGAILGIYEWWIPRANRPAWGVTPWYSGETALRNLRYWHQGGVRYLSYQTGGEEGNGFPLRWPLYYVGARGMWSPGLTSRQIMREACDRLYGDASAPMQRYYATIENAMLDAPETLRGFAWKLPGPEDIYPPAVEAAASAALEEAGRTAVEPAVAERIRQEQAIWDRARQSIAKAREAAAREKRADEPASREYR